MPLRALRCIAATAALVFVAAAQAPSAARPLSQIPAAKLATLRQLADLTLNLAQVRATFTANLGNVDKTLLPELQQKGLSAARAQEFITAFNQSFTARLATGLSADPLIQMLDAAYSDDQATQLLAFYQTPLGQRVAKMQPVILQVTARQVQQSLQQIGALAGHDVSGSFPELNQDTAPPPAGELPRPAAVENSLYPPVAQAPADLAAAEARAAANGHHVLVVFGANWCYDCHVLDSALHSPAYASLIAGYETVNVNVGDTGKDNADLLAKLGVDISHGVPALAVLNAHGTVLVAQKQSEFQNTRALQGEALRTFLKTWAPR